MVNQNVPVQEGWFEHLKEYVNPSMLMEKIKESKETIIDIILYLGIGFLLGFLLKRYSNYFIMLLGVIILVAILQYYDVMYVNIRWDKIQQIFGLHQQVIQKGDTLVSIYWQWIKLNFIAVLSFSFGFLFGLKMA